MYQQPVPPNGWYPGPSMGASAGAMDQAQLDSMSYGWDGRDGSGSPDEPQSPQANWMKQRKKQVQREDAGYGEGMAGGPDEPESPQANWMLRRKHQQAMEAGHGVNSGYSAAPVPAPPPAPAPVPARATTGQGPSMYPTSGSSGVMDQAQLDIMSSGWDGRDGSGSPDEPQSPQANWMKHRKQQVQLQDQGYNEPRLRCP